MPGPNDKFVADFTRQLKIEGKRTLDEVIKIEKTIVLDAFTSIIMKTPVDTGRARGNWQINTGGPAAGFAKTNSKTGRAPLRKGTSEINNAPAHSAYYIVNNVPYVPYLENGSSKQAPLGMVALTVQEIVTKFGGP